MGNISVLDRNLGFISILCARIKWETEGVQRCTDVPTNASLHQEFDKWWLCTQGQRQWQETCSYHREGYSQENHWGWTYVTEDNDILYHHWFQIYRDIHSIHSFWPSQANDKNLNFFVFKSCLHCAAYADPLPNVMYIPVWLFVSWAVYPPFWIVVGLLSV